MAYKDKDRQREAGRKRVRRYRARAKGVTSEGVTQGVTSIQNTPEFAIPNYGESNCQCQHCQTNRINGNKHTINHGPHKTAGELGPDELNRVSLPGDPDYAGVCMA